jgi:hypothetical protein
MKAKILVYAFLAATLATIHLADAQQFKQSAKDRLSRCSPPIILRRSDGIIPARASQPWLC